MENSSKKELRKLLIQLAANMDRIRQSDLSLETQVWVNECAQLCDQMLTQLYSSTPSRNEEKTDQTANPLKLASQKETTNAEEIKPINLSRKQILVIDDDEDTLRLLSYLLTKKGGFSVTCKSNPMETFEALNKTPFDVILMDLMMPQMNGFELLRRIRENGKWRNIKILVGSSRTFDKDKLAILQGGANDFIAKPYNLEELVLRLRNLTRQEAA